MSGLEHRKFLNASLVSLGRLICVLVAATGLFVSVWAICCLIAMLSVWFREPYLQPDDKMIALWAGIWLIASAAAVVFSWWLRSRTFPAGHPDRSLRLAPAESGRTDQIVHVWSELGLLAVVAVWIWGSCLAGLEMKLVVLAASVTTLYLAMHGRILVHELGHLLAARAVGLRQRKLQVGSGPILWSKLFTSGLLLEWRMFARGGWVLALPTSDKDFRIRQLLFVAAGPVTDLVLIGALFIGLTSLFGSLAAAFTHGVTGIVIFMLFWWTIISAVCGLIPHRVNIGGRRLWTDGYWLLLLCTGSTRRIKEMTRGFDSQIALEFLRSNPIRVTPINTENRCSPDASQAIKQFHEQRIRLTARLRPNLTA